MKIHKLIFTSSMMMGTLVTASSYSWFSMWMGLEINLLSVIPLFSSTKNIYSSESAMKYFITQAMASLILLAAVTMMLLIEEFINPQMDFMFLMMMNSALFTKIGAAPFHFWFPEVIEGLSWVNSLILLTWQKIAPMLMIMNNTLNMMFLMMVITTSLVISTISGFNQISLRKILAFSSINHIAWMLASMLISLSMWTIYFLVYSLININIIMMFSSTKTFYMSQLSNFMNQNKMIKFSFMVNFLSLGGLPPFIGFLPKWLVINWLTNNSMILITMILIVTTLIMLFIYMRILMSSMVMSTNEPKINTKMNNILISITNMTTISTLALCTLIPSFY
uniref:NADH dehydrogenase subunit 2 n=1 Tax=Strongylium nakanei TaxID=2969967 RepID=UPI002176B6AC|nr:NADH dehydrogenase subunit 2 [Strongylium nakanei]UUL71678.1 NADH dehydrogenase subunit 2 [Strongylium nakanei]